jgi:tetratricopeptide (TPR) repeat protein
MANVLYGMGQVDRAIAHYQAILNYESNNAMVLNNLAYEIATTKGKPQDALLYAERAATLAKFNPQVITPCRYTFKPFRMVATVSSRGFASGFSRIGLFSASTTL